MVVGATGIEPVTPTMSRQCSSAELRTQTARFGGVGLIGYGRVRQADQAATASIFWTSLTRSRRWIGLDSTLACFGAAEIRVERHRGKAGDEHDLDVGIEFGGAAGELDAVHFRHHDIGEQELERFLAQPLIGGQAVVVGDDLEPAFCSAFTRKRRMSLSSSARRIFALFSFCAIVPPALVWHLLAAAR